MDFEKVNVILRIIGIPENVRPRINYNVLNTTRVAALGSTPELGEWDTQEPAIAVPSSKFDSWEVRVQVSPNSSFDWCFAIYENDITKVKTLICTDSCVRTSVVGQVPCTFVAAWGRKGERRRADTCDVEVYVKFYCHHGQYLVLCGGAPVLGAWEPYYGVEAREEYPPGSGRWTSHLVLDMIQQYQAKWVVVEGPDRRVVRWEEFPPHILHVEMGVSRLVLEAEWNGATHVHERNFRLLSDTEIISDNDWLEMMFSSRDEEDRNAEMMKESVAVPRCCITGKLASESNGESAVDVSIQQAVRKYPVAGKVEKRIFEETELEFVTEKESANSLTDISVEEELTGPLIPSLWWLVEKILEVLDLIE